MLECTSKKDKGKKSMNKLWNNHMHCEFSGDSDTPMEDMITSSIKAGMYGITLTDHLDLDYYSSPHRFDLDIDSYRKHYDSLTDSSMYNKEFEVLWGIELGLQPHLAKKHEEIISTYNFDFVIGSTHQVDKIDPYFPEYFEKFGVKGGVRRFFEVTAENIEAYKNFDSYGHLDYIIRYSDEAKKLPYEEYSDIINEILALLIDREKALEINTGAFKFGLKEPNPCIATIKKYKEMGGKLITLGSDAHKTEQIGVGYDKISGILKECGFNSYFTYKNRKPIEYTIG